MKKFVALLVVLLCLLMGSALALEDNIKISGTSVTPSATPQYFQLTMTGNLMDGSASNYNVKVEKGPSLIAITFKDVYVGSIQSADIVNYNGPSSVVIAGEGLNTLVHTDGKYNVIAVNNSLSLKGSFEAIYTYGAAAICSSDGSVSIEANIQNLGSEQTGSGVIAKDVIDVSGHIGKIQAKQDALYGMGGLEIDQKGRIDEIQVGQTAIEAKSVRINGSIGKIQAGNFAIYVNTGDIVINGPIGETVVTGLVDEGAIGGIHTHYGKLTINNSVGPISVSGNSDILSAVFAHNSKGIELGEGISLLAPKDGRIADVDGYSAVLNPNGTVSHTAQFGTPVPEAPATGDSMNLVLWASLLTLSMIGIAVLTKKAKKTY